MSYPAPPYGTMPPVPAHEQAAVYAWIDDVFAQQGKLANDVDRAYWFRVISVDASWDFGYVYEQKMIPGTTPGRDPRTPPVVDPPATVPDPLPDASGVLDQALALLLALDQQLKDVRALEGDILAALAVIKGQLGSGFTNRFIGSITPRG